MANSPHADFVLESREHLQLFERSMLALEKATSPEAINDCIDSSLRAVHSLKGNAGFLGFQTVQRLAHATESVLENFRNHSYSPPTAVVEAILLASDRLSSMIEDLGFSESHDISELMTTLHALAEDSGDPVESTPKNVFPINLRMPSPPASVIPLLHSLRTLGSLRESQLTQVDLQTSTANWSVAELRLQGRLHTDRSVIEVQRHLSQTGAAVPWRDLGVIEINGLNAEQLQQQLAAFQGELVYEPTRLDLGLPIQPIVWNQSASELPRQPIVDVKKSPTNAPENTLPKPIQQVDETVATTRPVKTLSNELVLHQEPIASEDRKGTVSKPTGDTTNSSPSEKTTSLRIPVDLLDRLMNLVGELTLIRNQSLLAFEEIEGTSRAVIQRLNSVTSELQDAVLKTRMQPVGHLFGRFPRMVRDLARQLGKQVELVMVGQEVELDKTVLEQLSDPLTHLIRNSIDHGLETPEVRIRSDKQSVGRVTLSATAADGQVIIEIRDDGRGIDPNAVRAKVLALGLKTEAELQKISSKELYSYILLPGFSTARQVSDVSGRGVGMDVVKTNVERLEGSLTIDSAPGMGTSMILRVPLTLAIIPCLIVTVGKERFAVPQRSLEEIVCLHPGGESSIEHSYDSELLRLRDVLLPVVRFSEALRCKSTFCAETKLAILAANSPADRDPQRIEYILVLRTKGRKFGLLVDDVRGTEEVVVKPMHPSLRKIGIFAGATLMGDGRVALIANIDGIAEHADCYGVEPPKGSGILNRDPAEVHRVLLFEFGPKELFALPLVQVRRIESIAMNQVEFIGDHAFITIDGVSTRILRLDKFLNVSTCEESPMMHLILPKFVKEPIGILVSRIVDTESLSIHLQEASIEDPGILGTAIVRERLTLFLDIQYLREGIFGRARAMSTSQSREVDLVSLPKVKATLDVVPHILLVDDTPFFREVVRRYFERDGLVVTTAIDGNDGMQKLSEGDFDLVVSDIEMPNLDGWGFCQAARKAGYKTPFLALTSLSKTENSARAIECGFDGFEEKLDHDRLINSVRKMLGLIAEEQQDGN
jgi:two-component system, chemotaxis family, sensor kinase CheA